MPNKKIEQLAETLTGNITGWELSVLRRIGKRIRKIGGMTPADAASLNNAADVTRDMNAIVKELSTITEYTIPEVWNMYETALEDAQQADSFLYNYRDKVFPPIAEDKRALAMIRAATKNTGETMMNLAQTKMLFTTDAAGRVVSLQRAYYDVLDKAVTAVTSGATDFQTEMRESIRTLGGNGIRVNYGSGISRRLDTVVRQNLMWGAKQTSEEYQDMIGEDLGCDGIEIDWHGHPRPSHEFMQGKQFHIGGDAVIKGVFYPDATEALERLEDYNCYHYKTPIICGVSVPRYSPEELKRLNAENAKTFTIRDKTQGKYAWSQDMRKLESAIRQQKTIKEMAIAAGDKTLVKQCNDRIKVYMERYKEISDVTGIPMDTKRLSLVSTGNTSVLVDKPKPVDNKEYVKICELDPQKIVNDFPELQTNDVIFTNERKNHIKIDHPNDYDDVVKYAPTIITKPNAIFIDHENIGFVYYIAETEKGRYKLLVRLALPTDKQGLSNSIITGHKFGDKKYKKFMKNYRAIYKQEN